METERELGIGDPDSIFIWFVRLEAGATEVPPATAHQERPMLPCDFRGNWELGTWEFGIGNPDCGNWDLVCAVPGTRYHGPACHSSPGTW